MKVRIKIQRMKDIYEFRLKYTVISSESVLFHTKILIFVKNKKVFLKLKNFHPIF